MTMLGLIGTLVVVAALFGWVSTRVLRMPLTLGTMLLTFLASLALSAVNHGYPGLHLFAYGGVPQALASLNLESLILHGMLSLLLFAGAFLLDFPALVEQRTVIGVLAVAGTLLCAAVVAALMHLLLPLAGMRAGWLTCLLFGALISPTDPVAVLEMLRRAGAPPRLQAQLAGESLFNDGIGAVLFVTVLALSRGAMPTAGHIALGLLWQVGGALLLGLLGAWLTSLLMTSVQGFAVDILLTLALALGAYALADRLHFSAPLEAVIAGIALRRFNLRKPPETIAHREVDRFWEVLDEVQNAILFVLLGAEVLSVSLSGPLLVAGIVAALVVPLSRLGVVAGLIGSLRLRSRTAILPLSWGGLRGGLSIALALAVPHTAAFGWILPATYVVVVASILLQGGSMGALLRRANRT